MGLHQNGFRDNIGVFRYAGAGFSNGAYPSTLPINTHRTGAGRNLTAGEGIADDKVGIPLGYLGGGSWLLPQKSGNMSSHYEADFSIGASGSGVGGITTTGESAITFTVADMVGELISSGSGTASWVITTNNPLLTASIDGIGSTSFAITTNTPLLGAEASAEGSSSILFSCTATILPTDDTSPLREGTATLSITGALTPYAIGQMIGSTADATVLTVDAIAAAVLAAALTAPIHANIQYVNDVEVTGDGQTGTEWGPV